MSNREDPALNRDDILKAGFWAQPLKPRIFLIPDFATPGEIRQMEEELLTFNEKDWSARYLAEMRKNSLEKFGRDDIENLVEEGLLEVTDDWADKNIGVGSDHLRETFHKRASRIFDQVGPLDVTGFTVYQRMYEGSELKSHYDQYSDKLVEYAAVLYINDDYNGGEIFFEHFNLEVKPRAGSLIIFPGTEKYQHGVRTVKPGPVRYVIPTFIKTAHPDGAMAGWGDFG